MSYLDEPPPYRAGGLVGVGAYGVSRVFGLNLWLPVLLSLVAYFGLRRFRPVLSESYRYGLAILSGQALWMVVGVMFVPEALASVLIDIVASAALLIWAVWRASKASAYGVVAFEVISLGVNFLAFLEVPQLDSSNFALLVHMVMHVGVLIFVVHALLHGLVTHSADAGEMDEVFS
ncbi:MAG TPA: hypothetical protein VL094_03120 [Sphingomonadaceae bacterium]|nr:hypothetical protein [Sphingomonadaceae bacterium]